MKWIGMGLLALASMGAMKATRLEDLKTERLTLVDYSKQTLVTFIQPSCLPCKNQLTSLKCVQQKRGDRVTVLAVQSTGDSAELQRSLKPLHLNFPVLKGTPAFLASYEADQTPTPMTAIIAPGGKVTDRVLGAQSCEYWTGLLDSHPAVKP